MNRCRRIEYFTTNSTQSITDGLGAVKERQKWITKAGYELGAGRLNVLLVHTQTIFRWQACVLLRQ
ncbi:hypothetical protein GBAR_LOCUS18832 [Geodia barretti]|uniref:Uncharacterized protein n=1 Tax=Geodia barretti TaxID=519541 RepID=A0AA35X0K4_GEOBA|nr:hypothetical protein GBAR_LOCUS18832 [Geodia barretti]